MSTMEGGGSESRLMGLDAQVEANIQVCERVVGVCCNLEGDQMSLGGNMVTLPQEKRLGGKAASDRRVVRGRQWYRGVLRFSIVVLVKVDPEGW